LVNGRAWKSLPGKLQEVLAGNFNAAAVKEREDLVKLSQNVEGELEKLGLTFNRTDPGAFRAAVSRSGYYKQWKEAFGKEAWSLLEKYSGPLG
jgi:TRAP-type transport system periplasmic protein